MLISDSHRFIFIHNHKVAGSSIARSLSKFGNVKKQNPTWVEILKRFRLVPDHYPNPFPWHITARELRARLTNDVLFHSYYKFGFVRNPWDLQVSLYTYMLKLEKHNQHRLIKKMKDFDEYIDWRVNKDLKLQKDFFYDGDQLIVDYVGKFENLESDFLHICHKLNLATQLPHINKSRERFELGLYTQKTIDIVHEAFLADVEAFKYSKPSLF